jgi:hypothetical protein
MGSAGDALMRWFLRLFPEYRHLEAALINARKSDRQLFAEVIRLGGVAYDRRTALEKILACQTPGSNATVRRMAGIAADCLQATDKEDDTSIADVEVQK